MSPAESTPALGDRDDETIAPGGYWTRILDRWQRLRIIDVDGRQGCSLLAYNADETSERFNAPDTVKIQNQIFLTTGRVLFSDLGRVLFSIVDDTSGHHDALCRVRRRRARRGSIRPGTYRDLRNEFHRNARDNFVMALGRHGLGRRDLVMSFNPFARVRVAPEGALEWEPGAGAPGAAIELRAEMRVLVAISATPHVLDPSPVYAPGPLRVQVLAAPTPVPTTPCRTFSDEARRGLREHRRLLGRRCRRDASCESRLDPAPRGARRGAAPGRTVDPGRRRRSEAADRRPRRAQAVDTLGYDAHDYENRYSAANTIRRPAQPLPHDRSTLLSTDGDVLATIVADTCGRHDTVGGACSAESNTCRFGHHTRSMHNCRDNFLNGLSRARPGQARPRPEHQLLHERARDGRRSSTSSTASPHRARTWSCGQNADVLFVISNCPQLNNPCNGWNPTPIQLLVWDAG